MKLFVPTKMAFARDSRFREVDALALVTLQGSRPLRPPCRLDFEQGGTRVTAAQLEARKDAQRMAQGGTLAMREHDEHGDADHGGDQLSIVSP